MSYMGYWILISSIFVISASALLIAAGTDQHEVLEEQMKDIRDRWYKTRGD